MARLYVGNLDPRVTARELEDEFRTFGVLRRSVLSPQISHLCAIGLAPLGIPYSYVLVCASVWAIHKDK